MWISLDYGNTWSQITSGDAAGAKLWRSVSVSASGQYQSAVATGTPIPSNRIYISIDYGNTWVVNTSAPFANWDSVSVSASGQYQTAVSTTLGATGVTGATGGKIYISAIPIQTPAWSTGIYNLTSIGFTGTTGPFIYPNTTTTNVVIGSTAYLTSTAGFTGATGGPTGAAGIFQVNGSAYIKNTCTAQTFNAYSDYRIKQNVELLELNKYNIDNLRPIIYENKDTKQSNIGFLAHEVQEYFPFLVAGTKDGLNTQSVNYTGLIGVLTKEIQELKKRVSNLEIVESEKN